MACYLGTTSPEISGLLKCRPMALHSSVTWTHRFLNTGKTYDPWHSMKFLNIPLWNLVLWSAGSERDSVAHRENSIGWHYSIGSIMVLVGEKLLFRRLKFLPYLWRLQWLRLLILTIEVFLGSFRWMNIYECLFLFFFFQKGCGYIIETLAPNFQKTVGYGRLKVYIIHSFLVVIIFCQVWSNLFFELTMVHWYFNIKLCRTVELESLVHYSNIMSLMITQHEYGSPRLVDINK